MVAQSAKIVQFDHTDLEAIHSVMSLSRLVYLSNHFRGFINKSRESSCYETGLLHKHEDVGSNSCILSFFWQLEINLKTEKFAERAKQNKKKIFKLIWRNKSPRNVNERQRDLFNVDIDQLWTRKCFKPLIEERSSKRGNKSRWIISCLDFHNKEIFLFFSLSPDADENSGTSNPIVPSQTKIFSSKKKNFQWFIITNDDVKSCKDSKLK